MMRFPVLLFPLPGEREEEGVLEQLVSQPSEKTHDYYFSFCHVQAGEGVKT